MQKFSEYYNINSEVLKIVLEEDGLLRDIFRELEQNVLENSMRVLQAFNEENVSESDFYGTSGYGYNDIGRDKIERIFAKVLGSEDALVRNQFISGSHALTVALFGLLRPKDVLLSITGLPYDTLHEVIGIKKNSSSLQSFGIQYEQIDLINDDFDYEKIAEVIKNQKIKVVEIQRSKGYSTRKSIEIAKLLN